MTAAAPLVALMVLAQPALAWTELRGEDGRSLRLTADNPWRDVPYLPLVGNARNAWGVEEADLQAAVVEGLQRWQIASQYAVEFDYWQGSDTWFHPPRIDRDGVSTIFFASGADAPLPDGLSGVAWTEIWYDDLTGEIQEVDILLDDRLYDFSGNLPDLDVPVPTRPAVDLDAVVAHELGHALGLDHAAVAYGTMLPWIWPGQGELGCDDVVGVREIYGTTPDAAGVIVGDVVSQTAEGLAPQVAAISLDDGLVRAAVLAEGQEFTLQGLPAGRYALMVEPFLAGRDALGQGYGDAGPAWCGDGAPPERALLQDAEGVRVINLIPGGVVDVGQVDLPCSPMPVSPRAATELDQAPDLDIDEDGGFVWSDRFEGQPGLWYLRLPDLEGTLEIVALGPSLFSAARITPSLLDASGQAVSAEVASPRWESDDGFTNWDAVLLATDLPAGDYLLELEITTLPASTLPGGFELQDADAFVLLRGQLGEPLQSDDAVGGVCTLTEPLPSYQSPDSEPPRREVLGGCGESGGATSSAVRGLGLFGLIGLRRRRKTTTQGDL